MKILVTGAAGYLGSILTPMLLERGHWVKAVDNFMYQQTSLAACCYYPDFNLIRGDVRDDTLMQPLVEWADIVIPLAALVGAPLCEREPLAATSTNKDAILNMRLRPDQLVILPITNSGYGIGEPDKECTEDSPMRPISLYGRDKVELEYWMMRKHASTISFRFATLFGMSPRMRLDLLVNDFVYRAVTDRAVVLFEGHFKRNYLHVRDAARVILHGITNREKMQGQAYNVGIKNLNLSKRELCEAIQRHVRFDILESEHGTDPDKRDYVVCNRKIEQTGFIEAYSLDDGIRELVKGCAMLRNSRYGNN